MALVETIMAPTTTEFIETFAVAPTQFVDTTYGETYVETLAAPTQFVETQFVDAGFVAPVVYETAQQFVYADQFAVGAQYARGELGAPVSSGLNGQARVIGGGIGNEFAAPIFNAPMATAAPAFTSVAGIAGYGTSFARPTVVGAQAFGASIARPTVVGTQAFGASIARPTVVGGPVSTGFGSIAAPRVATGFAPASTGFVSGVGGFQSNRIL